MAKIRTSQPLGPRLSQRTLATQYIRAEYRLYRTQAFGDYHHNGVQIRVVGEEGVHHYSGSGVSQTIASDRERFIHGGDPDLPWGPPVLYLLKFAPGAIPGFDEPATFLDRSDWREIPRDPDVVFAELFNYGAHLVAGAFGYGRQQNSNTVFHDVLFITGGSLDGFDPGDPPGLRHRLRDGADISDQGGRDPLDGWVPESEREAS